jgi:CTP synthase (UTP-ammonia lyase)
MTISIAVVGEFSADNPTHTATNWAIKHAAAALRAKVESRWIGTDELAKGHRKQRLKEFHALWIAPGSPYKNMDAALGAIRFARENKLPLLGTCGGFQHIVLEHARNVMGFVAADHAESNPGGSLLFISRLTCSLAGRTLTIALTPNSLVARAYGKLTVKEGYYCNFGVNPDYVQALRHSQLQIVGSDEEGEVWAVELPDHPFFVGTLFIPQTNSTAEEPHPLIVAFLRAAQAKLGTP